MSKITDFMVKNLINEPESLSQYEGRVVLVVNTASACRFTPQYAQLQKLYEQYAERGLSVLAFPCNQFGRQESGSSDEIGAFCDKNFHVTFPVMGKVNVNGEQAEPVWQWLKSQAPGVLGTQSIKWNFTKFLIGRDGRTIKRYAPLTEPVKMVADIEQLLAQSIQS
jgi:glutathione peroxidase